MTVQHGLADFTWGWSATLQLDVSEQWRGVGPHSLFRQEKRRWNATEGKRAL